jgi:hypothetical protein
MTGLVDDVPEEWELESSSEPPEPGWSYKHRYLDVDLTVSKLSPEMSTTEEQEYMILLSWADGLAGATEAHFEPPSAMTSREEAANWTFALLKQITTEFGKDHTRYASRAIKLVKGESTSENSRRVRRDEHESECPICGIPFYKLRGLGSYEQAQTHLEYADDEEHEGFEA